MQSVLSLHSILYFHFAVGWRFSLLAMGYILSGVLFAIKCCLPSEKEEFAQLLSSNSLLDGYHQSLMVQTAFGESCVRVSTLCNFMVLISWSGMQKQFM